VTSSKPSCRTGRTAPGRVLFAHPSTAARPSREALQEYAYRAASDRSPHGRAAPAGVAEGRRRSRTRPDRGSREGVSPRGASAEAVTQRTRKGSQRGNAATWVRSCWSSSVRRRTNQGPHASPASRTRIASHVAPAHMSCQPIRCGHGGPRRPREALLRRPCSASSAALHSHSARPGPAVGVPQPHSAPRVCSVTTAVREPATR